MDAAIDALYKAIVQRQAMRAILWDPQSRSLETLVAKAIARHMLREGSGK